MEKVASFFKEERDPWFIRGERRGIEKGRNAEREKTVRNLVKASVLTDEQIASALEVTLEYVAGIRKEME